MLAGNGTDVHFLLLDRRTRGIMRHQPVETILIISYIVSFGEIFGIGNPSLSPSALAWIQRSPDPVASDVRKIKKIHQRAPDKK